MSRPRVCRNSATGWARNQIPQSVSVLQRHQQLHPSSECTADGLAGVFYSRDDRVGFGYQHSSCGSCAQCLRGLETYCSRAVMYGFADLDTGSMASHAVFRESFTYKIPSALSNETACALMCGGATVFALLDMFNVKPTDRVGIVGVGGLGHLAIQFAAKWGCEVVAFSGTADKRDDAMALGAKEFIVTKGLDAIKIPTTIDHLLVTSSKQVRWGLYLPIMAPCSTIYPLCVDVEDIKIPCIQFLCKGLRLQASVVAPPVVHKRMLDFAAVHDIRPMVMRYKLSKQGIEQAIEDLEKGRMRYKGVLSASG